MTQCGDWRPPGKNCGLCGRGTCADFVEAMLKQEKQYEDCPFYVAGCKKDGGKQELTAIYSGNDVMGNAFDFVLHPLPHEISARKIVLPFRSDLVEKLNIGPGDLVLGRPMGAGCPVPHVLKVISAEQQTGLLYTWVVGPKYSREQPVKDVTAYHMIGFEGVAAHIQKFPQFGKRVTFLPGFCMMNLNHTGLVNMILKKSYGVQVRIEDIRILAG